MKTIKPERARSPRLLRHIFPKPLRDPLTSSHSWSTFPFHFEHKLNVLELVKFTLPRLILNSQLSDCLSNSPLHDESKCKYARAFRKKVRDRNSACTIGPLAMREEIGR